MGDHNYCELLEECLIKVEEEEFDENEDSDVIENVHVKLEYSSIEAQRKEQNSEEEEVKSPVAVFLEPIQEMEEGTAEQEDPLAPGDDAGAEAPMENEINFRIPGDWNEILDGKATSLQKNGKALAVVTHKNFKNQKCRKSRSASDRRPIFFKQQYLSPLYGTLPASRKPLESEDIHRDKDGEKAERVRAPKRKVTGEQQFYQTLAQTAQTKLQVDDPVENNVEVGHSAHAGASQPLRGPPEGSTEVIERMLQEHLTIALQPIQQHLQQLQQQLEEQQRQQRRQLRQERLQDEEENEGELLVLAENPAPLPSTSYGRTVAVAIKSKGKRFRVDPSIVGREPPSIAEAEIVVDDKLLRQVAQVNAKCVRSEEDNANELLQYLREGIQGQMIIGLHEKGLLENSDRCNLAQIIIAKEYGANCNTQILGQRFRELARSIAKAFPGESETDYYISSWARNKKRNAAGKLYDVYTTFNRKMRRAGVRAQIHSK